MTHRDPLFSIVVQNYNYGRYVKRAIDSALAQTYSHVEVVVVDDGSTDGSADVIRAFGEAVRPVFKPNGGQASAMNVGLAASTGPYVLFLDADDLLYPNAAARHAGALGAGAVCSQGYLDLVDEQARSQGARMPTQRPADGDLATLALSQGPGGSCARRPRAPHGGATPWTGSSLCQSDHPRTRTAS